jgi:hypothetical protein
MWKVKYGIELKMERDRDVATRVNNGIWNKLCERILVRRES